VAIRPGDGEGKQGRRQKAGGTQENGTGDTGGGGNAGKAGEEPCRGGWCTTRAWAADHGAASARGSAPARGGEREGRHITKERHQDGGRESTKRAGKHRRARRGRPQAGAQVHRGKAAKAGGRSPGDQTKKHGGGGTKKKRRGGAANKGESEANDVGAAYQARTPGNTLLPKSTGAGVREKTLGAPANKGGAGKKGPGAATRRARGGARRGVGVRERVREGKAKGDQRRHGARSRGRRRNRGAMWWIMVSGKRTGA